MFRFIKKIILTSIYCPQAAKERRPFLRRTKATAPPDATDTPQTEASAIETTTSKYTRRGNNRFKSRKDEKTRESATEQPSLNSTSARSDRPLRNFVRRRLGGANSTTAKSTISTQSLVTRRPFRIASRRRPASSSIATTLAASPAELTTTPQSTTADDSEEYLQDLGDTDYFEDSLSSSTPKNSVNAQRRRPLIQLKNEDQNPSATTEEEKKRQSKKYSSSFKQNQLDEILKLRASAEVVDGTTDGKVTEDYSETAVALAAHQLLAAPVPIVQDYDEEPKTTRRTPTHTTTNDAYKYTNIDYTRDYSITPAYPEERSRGQYSTTRPNYFDASTINYSTLQTDPSQSTYTTSDTTDTRGPTRYTTAGLYTGRPAYTSSNTNPTISGVTISNAGIPTVPDVILSNSVNPTISGVTLNIGSDVSGESTARYTNFPTDGKGPTTTFTTNYETKVTRPAYSTNSLNPTPSGVSLNLRESTGKFTLSPDRDIPSTYPTFTTKQSRPAGFPPNLVNLDDIQEKTTFRSRPLGYSPNLVNVDDIEVGSTLRYQGASEKGPSTARYKDSSEKIAVQVVFAQSTGSEGLSREPSAFTRDYLLESPVTKTYDDEYQYLSPVTTPRTTTRKPLKKKTVYRRISSTLRPTPAPTTTQSPRRTTIKPFEKIPVQKDLEIKDSLQEELIQKKAVVKVRKEPNKILKPAIDYDYYDESHEKVKYAEGTKVIVHAKGRIECLDMGNFPHPTSCKKFISCARIDNGSVLGWEYVCPRGLSFDPVGGICNWSAGLGCDEKDA